MKPLPANPLFDDAFASYNHTVQLHHVAFGLFCRPSSFYDKVGASPRDDVALRHNRGRGTKGTTYKRVSKKLARSEADPKTIYSSGHAFHNNLTLDTTALYVMES